MNRGQYLEKVVYLYNHIKVNQWLLDYFSTQCLAYVYLLYACIAVHIHEGVNRDLVNDKKRYIIIQKVNNTLLLFSIGYEKLLLVKSTWRIMKYFKLPIQYIFEKQTNLRMSSFCLNQKKRFYIFQDGEAKWIKSVI